MFEAIREVCVLDKGLYDTSGKEHKGGKIGSIVSQLIKAGYTADQVRRYYGEGGWWYCVDWRGRDRHQPPQEGDIYKTIFRAKSDMGEA
jgi:hypothetical protein